ncbi:MAG: hypothetical protein IJF16_11165 [Clostridia bacterium]|nr:hypothetical protein [Clostridia bacterium]
MSLNTDTTMQVVPAYGYGGYGGGGMFGGDNAWWIILFLLFGYGNRGFGSGGGNYATQADLAAGFNNSAVLNNLNDIKLGQAGIQQTLCQGFNGVDRSIGELGYKLADCCCQTQRAIDGVNYNLATQACDTRNLIQNVGRDITDNANANTRAILDFLTQDKIATLTAENASLKQNAFITANQDAQTAEILRRLGRDCPIPAYWVSPPTPVQVPCNNGCGGNGFGYGFN